MFSSFSRKLFGAGLETKKDKKDISNSDMIVAIFYSSVGHNFRLEVGEYYSNGGTGRRMRYVKMKCG